MTKVFIEQPLASPGSDNHASVWMAPFVFSLPLGGGCCGDYGDGIFGCFRCGGNGGGGGDGSNGSCCCNVGVL